MINSIAQKIEINNNNIISSKKVLTGRLKNNLPITTVSKNEYKEGNILN